MTDWEVHGRELANCNCTYGCPCQFSSLPDKGYCEAAIVYEIDKGHYGDTRLDGVRCAAIYQWPGAVHEGNGTMQLIIDEGADDAQCAALEKIMTGEDTADAATMWWIYSKMSPRKLPTLKKPIESEIDLEGRIGHLKVADVFETDAEPIRNPVTGDPHRVRIDLPNGFEYRIAEIGSGSTRSRGDIALRGTDKSYAQFAELHLGPSGVIA